MGKKKPNGVLLWMGPSRVDGAAIFVALSGLVRPSTNPKTGPMVQTWAMRANVPPWEAVQDGRDRSVCGDCPLRPTEARILADLLGLKAGEKPPGCYVTTHWAVGGVYSAILSGSYPDVDLSDLPGLLRGKRTRVGAYGNASSYPPAITRAVIGASDAHTLYEHDWYNLANQWLSRFAMASVGSEKEREMAKSMGWRTFRLRGPAEPVLPGEIICPASVEAGHRTTCYDCLLCNGNSRKGPDIVIIDHGPTSKAHTARVMAGRRTSLPVVG